MTAKGLHHKSDNLAYIRDSLAIWGREDVRSHVWSLCRDCTVQPYVPRNIVEDHMKAAEKQFESMSIAKELDSSTYITLPVAIMLQESIYSDSATSLRVYKDNEDFVGEEQFFEPPWPRFLLFVHPFDGWGGVLQP